MQPPRYGCPWKVCWALKDKNLELLLTSILCLVTFYCRQPKWDGYTLVHADSCIILLTVINYPAHVPHLCHNDYITRASDISRKKTQNFAGFSGANSRKNRPISRDFRGKKVKIRSQIGRFRGRKVKICRKSADFVGFQWKKVKFRRIFGANS